MVLVPRSEELVILPRLDEFRNQSRPEQSIETAPAFLHIGTLNPDCLPLRRCESDHRLSRSAVKVVAAR